MSSELHDQTGNKESRKTLIIDAEGNPTDAPTMASHAIRFSIMHQHSVGDVIQLLADWEDSIRTDQDAKNADRIKELTSAIQSINRGKHHEITIPGDDEPCYWQRKEWVDYMLDLAKHNAPTTGD